MRGYGDPYGEPFTIAALIATVGTFVAANPGVVAAGVSSGAGLLGSRKARKEGEAAATQAQLLEARQAGYNVAAQQQIAKLQALQAMRAQEAQADFMRFALLIGGMSAVVILLIQAAKPRRKRKK